ncbi:hypothetical protein B0H14DRAFT_3559287 [Mycena olivaceomarginata]|nr:hypothetical protein B0H14DRAFT_3559287 [Mycena olivaceomarginata]
MEPRALSIASALIALIEGGAARRDLEAGLGRISNERVNWGVARPGGTWSRMGFLMWKQAGILQRGKRERVWAAKVGEYARQRVAYRYTRKFVATCGQSALAKWRHRATILRQWTVPTQLILVSQFHGLSPQLPHCKSVFYYATLDPIYHSGSWPPPLLPPRHPQEETPGHEEKKHRKLNPRKLHLQRPTLPIGDEGGLDAQGQNTAESRQTRLQLQWIASVSTTSPSTTRREDSGERSSSRPRCPHHPEKPTPGEASVNTSEEAVVQPHDTVSSRPKPRARRNQHADPARDAFDLSGRRGRQLERGHAGLRASTRNSPRGLPREDDFESDGRDHSVIFVDSDDEDPTLKLSVKKERHNFTTSMHWNTTRRPSRPHLPAAAPCHPSTRAGKAPAPPAASRYRPHPSPQPRFVSPRQPTSAEHTPPSSPRPPPTPILESDFDDSDDDYEKGQALKKRAKTWQRNHGGRVSPSTESEDEEEDQAMEGEASPEPKRWRGEASAEPKSKTSRGKQKQKTEAEGKAEGCDGRGGGRREEGEEDTEHHKSGPIPAETKKRLNDLYDKFLQDVDGLAAECGKSSTSLHAELHLVAKLPRATSVWNMWQRYFAEKTPEDEKEQKTDEYYSGDESRHRVPEILDRGAGPDFPPDKVKNTAAVLKQLPWLIKFSEDLTEAAAQQFKALYKVHMWGYVIDPHARASFVFGAGDDFKEMRAQTMTHIEQEIRNQELAFGKETTAKHNYRNIAKKKRERGTVPKRDAQLHNFTKIVSTQLWAVCDSAGTLSKLEKDTRKVKMAWNDKFIDRAHEGEFRIVCYPTALEEADMIIGARKFSPKKIKASLFDKFLGKLAEGNRTGEMTGVMHFEFWSQDEMDLPLEKQGEVAVVQNAKGRPLVRVKDSDVWHKQVDAEAKKAKKAAEKAQKKVTKATASKPGASCHLPRDSPLTPKTVDTPALRPNLTAHGFASVHLLAPTPHPAALHLHALSRSADARVRLTGDTFALGTTPDSAWVPDRSINSPPRRSPPTRAESSRQCTRTKAPQYVNSYDSRYDPRYAPRHDPRYNLQHDSGYNARYAPSYDSRYDPRYDPRDRQYDGRYESRHQSRPRSPLRGPATHTATDGGHTEGKREDRLAARRRHVGGAPREDRLAARVGSAPRDQEALGTGSTSGGKRKDMHDRMVEEAERDVKRSRLATEPVAALVKMRIIPGGQTIPENGRVFYATRLEKTTIVGKADRYTFIHDAEKKKWVRMPAGVRPVCVGEQLERYKRELKTHFP